LAEPALKLISDEVAAFLAQGVSLLVATCDAMQVPECMRAVGLRVHPDRGRATIYLPGATSAATRANLLVNARIALLASYPLDHRSLQLKGRVVRVDVADDAVHPLIEAYLQTFASVLEVVGMPPEVVRMVAHWPSFAVEFEVEELYQQTPGPGAGLPLVGPL
jgi:hypothetical protein